MPTCTRATRACLLYSARVLCGARHADRGQSRFGGVDRVPRFQTRPVTAIKYQSEYLAGGKGCGAPGALVPFWGVQERISGFGFTTLTARII